MPWLVLLTDLRVWLAAALIATGLYAAVQRLGWQSCKAEFSQFRADIESEAAKAKVKAAQDEARHAQAAQEVLDDLQTRYAALSARYSRLRANSGSPNTVPSLSSAAQVLSTCAGESGQSDANARFLAEVESRVTAITEAGDREIAKYRELWELQLKNSGSSI